MKFRTGSNAERTQKYGGSKYTMTYIRPNIYINKLVVWLSTNGERALNYTIVKFDFNN